MNETTTTEIKADVQQNKFKFVMAEPRELLNIVKSISALMNEGTFKITPYDISLCGMCPANVSMVNLKLLSSAFIEFNTYNKSFNISLNLNQLTNVLKTISNKELLTIESIPGNKIKVNGFELPLIEIEEREQKRPELNFNTEISLEREVLRDIIKKAAAIAESLKFSAENRTIVFSAESDLNKFAETIKESDTTRFIKSSNSIAKYSLEYLKKIIAFKSNEVKINFGSDYPLMVTYIKVDRYKLEFILAPRIDNN